MGCINMEKVDYTKQIKLMDQERIISVLNEKMNKLNEVNNKTIEINNKYIKMNYIAKKEFEDIFSWIIEDIGELKRIINKEEEC